MISQSFYVLENIIEYFILIKIIVLIFQTKIIDDRK